MLAMLAKLRWRRSAKDAISPAHFGRERMRMAAAIADLASKRQKTPGDPIHLSDRSTLEASIAGLLDDGLVRASLALRHLEGLYDAVRYAEYEDASLLEREAAWKSAYFQSVFASPVSSMLDWKLESAVHGPEHYRLEEFQRILADAFLPRLQRVSGLAA